ncbi:hypothetical protein FJ492_19865 [Mesorhizobium sp. B2-5-4]|uniref:hypothetical protein n=1 Tax=Mesorhizobium sp. B2-5-4 TaxID=2589926 RepID=UPI00112CD5B8|nr:hypothetical protein [Mesorhizobium sp. B2-5-4]TPK41262.1 hypothetical protein FJ492_19865 [Mesorhizobium sp. B2-5-4]
MSIWSITGANGRLYRNIVAVLAIAISIPTQAFADSSFRGFTVSDSPDQVDKTAKSEGFTVKWRGDDSEDRRATLLDGDNECGWITFNGDSKVEKMVFAACFFGADGLGLRQVTQEFVNKFGGSAETEVISDEVCKGAQPFAFKGRTSEGELFRIEEDCNAWALYVAVEIKPGSGKGLKF